MLNTIVNTLAKWAWESENGSDISADFCVENFFPFPPMPCLIALAMKGLGIAIITGACLNKAPLIINIVNNKSVAGMSSSAVYGETLMYANAAFYSVLKGNPFTTYGENLILTFQSVLVCILCWNYAIPKISIMQRLSATVVFGIYLFLVFVVLKSMPEHYHILMSINLPVLIFSRGSQVMTFWKCKHTGTQSIITNGMNTLGSAIRMLTTISEIGFDIPMLTGYAISLILNLILVSQFFMYSKKTEEYLKSLKGKKE